ncbi:HET-domain-containing protein [Hypoxylon trugodes]|uniref:HET-domain-containing protein n=1 Tax=Hypoxylon trugodes TaxID=326681 RepID=UPI0021993C04|nr:HET-domain-containing protein [Hypoxylon trugodes]KAI1388094.1 HET-domain-containing protein [Hypoxylon trugodes]
MKLINCLTLEVEEFVQDVPPYAILSHTWTKHEVTYRDMNNRKVASRKEGYPKIVDTCRVASEYGLEYVWIDTCCIDKSSSAELSEAINSMFAWYKESKICIVFLTDFTCFSEETLVEIIASFDARQALEDQEDKFYKDPPPLTTDDINLRDKVRKELGSCKWFSRGWTLQELIAPYHIQFYDKDWNCFGSKLQLASVLSWITGVDTRVLSGKPLESVLVGRRMSWASNRTTTRVEDMAYCLLGIFDINMPLLYGEGKKAFIRLQEEIIKSTHDLSIFAWKSDIEDRRLFRGLMASSPSEFKGCHRLTMPAFIWNDGGEYGITSKGLRTEGLIRIGRGEPGVGSYYLPLHCVDERQKKHILAVKLRQYGPGLFARLQPWPRVTVVDLNVYSAARIVQPQYIQLKDSPWLDVIVLSSRTNAIQIDVPAHIFDVNSVTAYPQADWDLRNSILLSFHRPYFWGMWKAKLKDKDDGIAIVCVRSSGWLLYGIFALNKFPPGLDRHNIFPSQVEEILQRIPDRAVTRCSTYIHTIKDSQINLGEDAREIPATLLQVSCSKLTQLRNSRSGITRVQNLFKKVDLNGNSSQ